MKKLIFLTLSFFLLVSCFKVDKEVKPGSDHPSIVFLQTTSYADFYLMDSFNDNEEFVKYLIHFISNQSVRVWIVTDMDGVVFEDGTFHFNVDYQRFVGIYENEENKMRGLRINFLNFDKILFDEAITKTKTKLTTDFDSLNLGITQKFLNFTEKNPSKKNEKTYTYELYNSEGTKKIVQVYHDYGEWFTIDVL